MRWEDEQWIKSYTRDTVDWLALSYDARSLFLHLLRKVDRAGILPLGRHGRRGVAVLLGAVDIWTSRLEPALGELEKDGCVRVEGDRLVLPNFTAAQEARSTDKARKQAQRARDRAQALNAGSVTGKDAVAAAERAASHRVTPDVTSSHAASHEVTNRIEETRVEEKRTPLPPSGDEGAPEQRQLLDIEQPARTPTPAPDALRELWNRLAPLGNKRPMWQAMDGARERDARKALEVCPDLGRWEAFLRWHWKVPFYRGEEGWKGADVAWLLRKERARQVCDFDPNSPPPLPARRAGAVRTDTTPSDFSRPPEGPGWEELPEFDPAAPGGIT